MARFRLHCRHPQVSGVHTLIYDNATSALTTEKGLPVVARQGNWVPAGPPPVSAETPGTKRGQVRRLKISLGLSCNLGCSYCSQRFVPRAGATGTDEAMRFLEKAVHWLDIGDGDGVRIEYWGGEPLIYWKTLRFLGDQLAVLYPAAAHSIITNGTLLTPEIADWLVARDFFVAISHDGPGQAVRGEDPLKNPETLAVILSLYRRLASRGRFSFNPVLNRRNQSRAAIVDFFRDLTGDEHPPIGEGDFVDAYDAGGLAESLSDSEAPAFRARALDELRGGGLVSMSITKRIADFAQSIRQGRPAGSLGQKCGMDRPDNMAVTLKGEVLTCQNTSPAALAPNGQPHLLGTVDDLEGVRLRTATHWSLRPDCKACPVLHLCKGSCMFLEGPLWEASCRNSYSDNAPFFAAAVAMLTGLEVFRVEPLDAPLAEERQWLWQPPPTAPRT